MWWPLSVLLAFKRLKQEDGVFEASLGYVVRLCLSTNKQTRKIMERERRETRKKENKRF